MQLTYYCIRLAIPAFSKSRAMIEFVVMPYIRRMKNRNFLSDIDETKGHWRLIVKYCASDARSSSWWSNTTTCLLGQDKFKRKDLTA